MTSLTESLRFEQMLSRTLVSPTCAYLDTGGTQQEARGYDAACTQTTATDRGVLHATYAVLYSIAQQWCMQRTMYDTRCSSCNHSMPNAT